MVQLRDWQMNALQEWIRCDRRGIIAAVTGGGKTIVALEAARWSINQNSAIRVLIVVPTVALQEQWLEEIQEQFPTESVDASVDQSSRARFTVLVSDTARVVDADAAFHGDWLQIIDECHRVASPENRRAMLPNAWASLGLSATPERQYDDYLERFVIPVLGPVIYRYTYREALRDGVVAQFELRNYRVPVDDEELARLATINRQIAAKSRVANSDEDVVRRLLIRRARVVQGIRSREPVAVSLALEHSETSSIVFHESTAAADRIAHELRRHGIPTSVYHSRMQPEIRRRDLHLFRIGATAVMVCCRALDEGINIPRAKYAVVAASTASTRQRIQRLGRMLRPDDQGSHATIATLYATDSEAERLVQEQSELEGLVGVRWFRADMGSA